MQIIKKLIDPITAKTLLNLNTKNRKIKPVVVARYTKDMLEGRWREDTGETIKISKSGDLLDGQHRLQAIINSKQPQGMHISYDVDESNMNVIDTGSARTPGDIFSLSGIPNAFAISPAIASYLLLKNGKFSSDYKTSKSSTAVLLDEYNKNPWFWQMANGKCKSWYLSLYKAITPSMITSNYAIFYNIDTNAADDFMNQLCLPNNSRTEIITQLKHKLMQNKISKRKFGTITLNALIIKTWNYYRKNSNTRRLVYELGNEKFPIAI